MYEATETIFRQCLNEALVETLKNDPVKDREELIRDLAARWQFNVSDYLGDAE